MGNEEWLNTRRQVLKKCIQKLSRFSKKLVTLRYSGNHTYEEISGLVKRSVNALYVAFNRIHKALKKCVRKNMESA